MRPKGQHCLTRFLPKVLHLLEGQPDLLSRRCNSSHRLRFKGVNCQKVLPFSLARRPLRLVTSASGSGGLDVLGVDLSPALRSDAKSHRWFVKLATQNGLARLYSPRHDPTELGPWSSRLSQKQATTSPVHSRARAGKDMHNRSCGRTNIFGNRPISSCGDRCVRANGHRRR